MVPGTTTGPEPTTPQKTAPRRKQGRAPEMGASKVTVAGPLPPRRTNRKEVRRRSPPSTVFRSPTNRPASVRSRSAERARGRRAMLRFRTPTGSEAGRVTVPSGRGPRRRRCPRTVRFCERRGHNGARRSVVTPTSPSWIPLCGSIPESPGRLRRNPGLLRMWGRGGSRSVDDRTDLGARKLREDVPGADLRDRTRKWLPTGRARTRTLNGTTGVPTNQEKRR